MWVYFNDKGQLLTNLEHGEVARVGTTAFSIFAVFDGIDSREHNITATIKLRKPDFTETEYPILLMDNATRGFTILSSENSNCIAPFRNNALYGGFLFDFAAWNETQNVVQLLDTPGLWTATITLFNSTRTINVQGVVTFNVGGNALPYDPDETVLSYDEVITPIIIELAKKANINKVIITINNAEAEISDYEDGQIFFNKENQLLYTKYNDALVPFSPILDLSEFTDGFGTLYSWQLDQILKGNYAIKYQGSFYYQTYRDSDNKTISYQNYLDTVSEVDGAIRYMRKFILINYNTGAFSAHEAQYGNLMYDKAAIDVLLSQKADLDYVNATFQEKIQVATNEDILALFGIVPPTPGEGNFIEGNTLVLDNMNSVENEAVVLNDASAINDNTVELV